MKRFKAIAEELRMRVSDWEVKFKSLSRQTIYFPRNKQGRSIKQIVGHMIDSVSNNTHRLVHLQYQDSPFEFPDYAVDGNNQKWIEIQNYQEANWDELVQLWKFTHLHFAFILIYLDDDKLRTEWIAGPEGSISLEEMLLDFPRHFDLHIKEIIDLVSASVQ